MILPGVDLPYKGKEAREATPLLSMPIHYPHHHAFVAMAFVAVKNHIVLFC
jgi:hypothetical protein